MKTTAKSLTVEQINALAIEAGQAGDSSMVNDCNVARGGYDSSCTPTQAKALMRAARARIVAALNDANAQVER